MSDRYRFLSCEAAVTGLLDDNDDGRPGDGDGCGFARLLGPYHDGELSAARGRAVAEHVRGCPACAAELADVRRFAGALRSADEPLPSMEQVQRWAALAPAGVAVPAAGAGRHVRHVRWLSAAAAAVGVFATGQLVYQRYKTPSPADGPPGVVTGRGQRPESRPHAPAPRPRTDGEPGRDAAG